MFGRRRGGAIRSLSNIYSLSYLLEEQGTHDNICDNVSNSNVFAYHIPLIIVYIYSSFYSSLRKMHFLYFNVSPKPFHVDALSLVAML